MASVRALKKDIDLMLSLVLNDCFYVVGANEKADEDAIMIIAAEVMNKHRELRKRVNHPDGKDNSMMVKQFYKSITVELLSVVDKALIDLGKAVK
jgi:hypothetical protein